MQSQERAQAVYPVDHKGLSPTTGVPPSVREIVYIDSYLDPSVPIYPARIAALHRAVMEIVVDAPLNPPAPYVQSRVATPPAPRPAPLTATHRRPPPVTPHTVPRPRVLPAVQQAPRPTARSIMVSFAPHINLVLLQEIGEGEHKDFLKVLECYLKATKK
ncbi:hypothetical protein BGX24_001160, partial [Mortierella sp. AD032]